MESSNRWGRDASKMRGFVTIRRHDPAPASGWNDDGVGRWDGLNLSARRQTDPVAPKPNHRHFHFVRYFASVDCGIGADSDTTIGSDLEVTIGSADFDPVLEAGLKLVGTVLEVVGTLIGAGTLTVVVPGAATDGAGVTLAGAGFKGVVPFGIETLAGVDGSQAEGLVAMLADGGGAFAGLVTDSTGVKTWRALPSFSVSAEVASSTAATC